jgi:hypothetical protein
MANEDVLPGMFQTANGDKAINERPRSRKMENICCLAIIFFCPFSSLPHKIESQLNSVLLFSCWAKGVKCSKDTVPWLIATIMYQ